NRHEIELRFRHEPERALGSAQHGVQAERASLVAKMGEGVPSNTAIELEKAFGDERPVLLANPVEQPMNRTDAVGPGLDRSEIFILYGRRVPTCAVEQHRLQLQHVIAGLSIQHGAL